MVGSYTDTLLNTKVVPTDSACRKCRLLQKCKDKAKQSFRRDNVFFFSLRFYVIETGAKRLIQASGEMTDTSISVKSPVLEASTTKLQFEFDK